MGLRYIFVEKYKAGYHVVSAFQPQYLKAYKDNVKEYLENGTIEWYRLYTTDTENLIEDVNQLKKEYP